MTNADKFKVVRLKQNVIKEEVVKAMVVIQYNDLWQDFKSSVHSL